MGRDGRMTSKLLHEEERLPQELRRASRLLATAGKRAQELVEEAEVATARLRALQYVTEAALAPLSLDHLLHEILDRIRAVLHGDTATILLLSEDGRELVERASSGVEEEVAEKVPVPVGRGVAGCIAASRQPMVVEDLSKVETVSPTLRGKIRSLIGAPLMLQGRVIGVVHVGTTATRKFSDDDLKLLQLVADRAALAIERARAEETRSQLAAIVESSEDAIVGMTLEGTIVSWSPGAERLYGYSAEEARGKPYSLIVPPERLADVAAMLERLQRGERAEFYETVRIRKDGRRIEVSTTMSPIRDAEGRIVGASTIARDITASKELERMREEWTSVIAHDMRQPITIILGYAATLQGLLQQQGCPETTSKAVEHIRTAAENLNKITGDLLDLSRLEARRMKLELRTVDPQALVREVVERTAEITRGHPVRVEVLGTIPQVQADPGRLEQVLGNLLSNAAKYGYPNTEILVEVERKDEQVQVSVTNRGRGIPPEELPQIFTRFHRTRWVQAERVAGLGLGLYISKGLVEAHGGRIWAESVPNQSTTFRFTLPTATTAPES